MRSLISVLVLVFIMSCYQSPETKSYGGTLRIGIFQKPTEINPLTTDSGISSNLMDFVFNTLIRYEGESQIRPELATRWEISDDGLLWTFDLRQDVFFHDGHQLTAKDVKFTFDTIASRKRGGNRHAFLFIKEVRVVNPYQIQILLSQPDNLLWKTLSAISIAPKHRLDGADFSAFNAHPIGSGPYLFSHRSDEEIVFIVNKNYFRKRSHLDRILVKILPSQQSSLSYLMAGKIDLAFLLNPEDFGALSQIPEIKIYHNRYPILHMLSFNLKEELFKNKDVRRALNFAVDKKQILRRVLKERGVLAGGTVPPTEGLSNTNAYPYQPNRALQILEDQGWKADPKDFILRKDQQKFEFTLLAIKGHDSESKALKIIREQLRLIGIRMKIQLVPFDDFIRKTFRERSFQSNFIHLVASPLNDNDFIFWHSGEIKDGLNYTSYQNPQLDRLLDQARMERDATKRRRLGESIQQILHDDPPGIFLFWRDLSIAVDQRFRNIPEVKMDGFYQLVDVWLPQKDQ